MRISAGQGSEQCSNEDLVSTYARIEKELQNPPVYDLDALKEIPKELKRFDYIYGAGTDASDIHRFFMLPDSFLILTRRWSWQPTIRRGKKSTVLEFEQPICMTVKEYRNQIKNGSNLAYELDPIKWKGNRWQIDDMAKTNVLGPENASEAYALIKNGTVFYKTKDGLVASGSEIRRDGKILYRFPHQHDDDFPSRKTIQDMIKSIYF